MVQEITKGIKVSVKTVYNGTMYRGHREYFAFSYFISIENKSEETVQLLERNWVVRDSLNETDFIQGEGVVGQTPVLPPNSEYNYKSNCFLISPIGAMEGSYKMKNLETGEIFFADIPNFKLTSTFVLN